MQLPDKSKELVANMRFYGDMRFKQLTLFMAWLTISVGGVAQFGETQIVNGTQLKGVIAVASMLFTAVLWIMEVRSSLYWVAHREEVRDLWPSPGNLRLGWLNATNSVFLLYAACLLYTSPSPRD